MGIDSISSEKIEKTDDVKSKPDLTKKELTPGQTIIRENQSNITYDKLFGEYVLGSKNIRIEDPYIRLPYQMNLLLEFCSMVIQNKKAEDEIAIHLVTWNEPEEMLQESTEHLNEIANSLFDSGIKLTLNSTPTFMIDLSNAIQDGK